MGKMIFSTFFVLGFPFWHLQLAEAADAGRRPLHLPLTGAQLIATLLQRPTGGFAWACGKPHVGTKLRFTLW